MRLSVNSAGKSPYRSPIRVRQGRKGLTEEQVTALRDTFALLDSDSTGTVSLTSALRDMQSMGLHTKLPVVFSLLSTISTTSPTLNFDAFLTAFETKVVNTEGNSSADLLFDALDEEKKDALHLEKLCKIAKDIKTTGLTQVEVEEMVKKAGKSGSEITREEFRSLMTRTTF